MAIARACAAGRVPAQVALVLSDVADAGILERAREHDIPARYLPPGRFRTKLDEETERAYIEALRAAEVDLVVLAGFMRVLKDGFLRAFAGRIVNIHPSLLPSFPGLEAWKQAFDHGVKIAGCTVHFVTPLLDHGPIIAQGVVSVMSADRPETLASRLLKVEHIVYPRVATWLAEGRVHLTADQRVVVDGVDSRLFFLEQRT